MANRKLIKKLDTIFSKYIRLRDSRNGTFKCCSCGHYKPYEQADAGHFVNRRWMAVRWDERNVHAQCRSCNRFDEGNAAGYTMFMLEKYGKGVVDMLQAQKIPYKWTDGELDILIKEYKRKVKEWELKHGSLCKI